MKTFLLVVTMLISVSFTIAQPSIWHQGFESADTANLPFGWKKYDNSPNSIDPIRNWTVRRNGVNLPGLQNAYIATAHSGIKSIGVSWHAGLPSNISDAWLVTPRLVKVPADGFLSFWMSGGAVNYRDSCSVWITTGNGTPGSFLTSPSNKYQSYVFPAGSIFGVYQQFTVNLSSYAGKNIYIGFRYNMNVTVDGFFVHLDDVNYNGTAVTHYGVVENFDYPNNTLLTSTPIWYAADSVETNPITVNTTGLTFPAYSGSGIGNKIDLKTSGEDDSASIPFQNSGSMYVSFMANISTAQAAGDYFFTLSSNDNLSVSRGYIKSNGTGFQFGIKKANEEAVTWGPATYNFGTTYLIVNKYKFIPGSNNDEASLFVFDSSSPPASVEPTATIGPISSVSPDASNISKYILRQGSAGDAPALSIDGIYVEDSWNNNVLPVELSSFTSLINNRDVTLNWSTNSELNNRGYYIERSSNEIWSDVGFVEGNGTSATLKNYSFTDKNLNSGNYSYRLKQTDFNGNFEYFNLTNEVVVGIPVKFELSQNYPNPFNPSTNIEYQLPADGNVNIIVFDNSGKEVITLVNEFKAAGYYTESFNGSSLSSGVYFYKITSGNFSVVKKMMLVK